MDLKQLRKKINYQWKIQSFNKAKTKASCVAYVDARNVMDLLDEVCGAENWQDDYKIIDKTFFAGIGIKCGTEWVWKWDTGTESAYEKEKGQFSDGFKRASVKWGIGRFLYNLDVKWIDVKNNKPIDKQGNIIWDLTKYFNDLNKKIVKPNIIIKPQTKTDKQELSSILNKRGIKGEEQAVYLNEAYQDQMAKKDFKDIIKKELNLIKK